MTPAVNSVVFVLVHGAFHGGWCWRPVARGLRKYGYEVYTPTQTGLGERSHLMSGQITMETFIQDVASVIEKEELERVVLVGHSYGARTITGVADRMPDRLHRLVYIDGGFPFDGLSRLETLPKDKRAERLERARSSGGISVPPPPSSTFGVEDPALQAWVDRHLTPQPVGAESSRMRLDNPIGNGLPVTYVRCTAPEFAAIQSSAEYAKAQQSWAYKELEAGHDVIVTHPDWVVDLLLEAAGA